jgi:hypothetical protein
MDRGGETSVLWQALGFFLLCQALLQDPAYIVWASRLLSSLSRRGLGFSWLGPSLILPPNESIHNSILKTRPAGGKTAPSSIQLRRKVFSRRPRKLSNPSPPPPYTGASAAHVRAGSVPRTEPLLGRALACALRMRRGEGVFLTQGEIRSPPGISVFKSSTSRRLVGD